MTDALDCVSDSALAMQRANSRCSRHMADKIRGVDSRDCRKIARAPQIVQPLYQRPHLVPCHDHLPLDHRLASPMPLNEHGVADLGVLKGSA